VVGPGTADQFDGSGFLANWNTYVTNGILSSFGEMQLELVCLADSCVFGESDIAELSVYVNGRKVSPVDMMVHVNGDRVCPAISTKYLMFPQLGVGGAAPTAAMNNVTFSISGGGSNVEALVQAGSIGVQLGTVSIKAMAPVIMIHGWRAVPARWGDSPPPSSSPCGPDKGFTSGKSLRNGGFGFIDPFVAAKVPFDCSIELDQGARVVAGGSQLQGKLLSCSDRGVPDANFLCPNGSSATGKLAQFGAKHAHLVTHSTGALWARHMLKNVASSPDAKGNHLFGIYSMITFNPPSHGSVLADILIASREAPLLGILTTDLRFLAALGQGRQGADDLTVSAATQISDSLGIPPGIPGQTASFSVDGVQNSAQYYTFGADADTNHNGKIDGATASGDTNTPPDEGYPAAPINRILSLLHVTATRIQDGRYQALGKMLRVNIHAAKINGHTIIAAADEDSTSVFQKNDLTVTVASALAASGFTQPATIGVCNNLPCLAANHTTSTSSYAWNPTAQLAVALIQSAQK
jgi:hypothetical protein